MFGLFNLSWWGYLIVLLVLMQITILATTLFLHRAQAHRALELHPIISHFFRFWLWLTTGTITKEWVAVHRKHHAKVETAQDPHSPQQAGIKKVLFEGFELYRKEAQNQETLVRYGDGTPNDWLERNIYTKHSSLGILFMLAIHVICFGSIGITVWALQMACIPFFAAGVINGVGHYIGYRNYETQDASRNIFLFGFFLGGEELHNNHHAFATSAKFSAKWWEFDMGWLVIRCLQAVKLAKPKRILRKLHHRFDKDKIDNDTLKACITCRLQLMSNYAREVIIPVFRQEREQSSRQGRRLLAHAKALFIRDLSQVKPSQGDYLKNVLDHFQSLNVVYQFRLRLQDIWTRSTANQKELLEALQEWCQQAEATGIEVLQRFVLQLKTYEAV